MCGWVFVVGEIYILLTCWGEWMQYSLGTHVRETTPDVLYGYIGQLRVDCRDDFLVWLLELWASEPPGKRFGGGLVL